MTSIDKYALIPFAKYQKLLKSLNTKEPTKEPQGIVKDPNNTESFHITQTTHPSSQIGRGEDQTRSGGNEAVASNDNVSSSNKTIKTNSPPPGIPSGDVDERRSDRGWLSYWEGL